MLAAIQTWPNFLGTVAMMGLPEALVYFSAKDPDHAGRYLGSATAFAFLMSFPSMAAGYLLMPIFLSAQSPDVISMARWYLLLVPLRSIVGMSFHPLRGLNDFAAWNGLRISPTLAWLAVLVGAWLFGRAEPQMLAAAYLCALALLLLPILYIVGCRVSPPFYPEVRRWKALLRFGIPSMTSGVPHLLNFRLDQMMMAAFLPAKALGLYVVAAAWSRVPFSLLNAVGVVLFPKVASQKEPRQQARAFAQGSRFGVLLSLAIAVPSMILTPRALPLLFGGEFSAAIPVALVLVVAGGVQGINFILEEGFRGLGRPTAVMRAEFGGLAVMASSIFILMKVLGIVGVALAALFGYATVTIILMVQGLRFTGYPLSAFICPRSQEVYSGWQKILESMRKLISDG